MMGLALIATVLPSALPAVARDTPSICWIADVVTSENGVRIYFNRKGGPLFVEMADRLFRPADAPVDAARPDEAGVEVRLGDKLRPSNSPEDGCMLEVVRRDGRLGIKAEAFFHPPGLPPASKKEFIPAHD